MVRRLHHRQLFLLQEPAHGHLQERARRHVVAVKNRNKLPGGILQRVVDVPRLSVFVRRTGDVLDANLLRELAERRAVAVIQDPDLELVFRPVDAQRGIDGVLHHAQVFVVGRHEEIDGWPLGRVLWQRNRLAVERPDHLEIAQHQHNPGIGFSKQQHQAAHQTHRVVPVQRRGITPPDVAAGDGQRQYDQHQRREATRNSAHQQRHAPQQDQESELRQRVERLRNTDQRQNEREHDDYAEDKTPQARVEMPELFMVIQMAGLIAHAVGQSVQPLMVAFT